jgi:hypothetical protein
MYIFDELILEKNLIWGKIGFEAKKNLFWGSEK